MFQRLLLLMLGVFLLASCSSGSPSFNDIQAQAGKENLIKDISIVAKTPRMPFIKGSLGHVQQVKQKNIPYDMSASVGNQVLALIVEDKEIHPNNKGMLRFTIFLDDYQEKTLKVQLKLRDGSTIPIAVDVRFTEYDPVVLNVDWHRIRFHAIVIGISQYEHLPRLNTPVNDAKEISRILDQKYGFNVRLITNRNATSKTIIDEISTVTKQLKRDDALLIYYAGHGFWDKASGLYYWQPVEADSVSESSWIMTQYISGKLKGSKSDNILVIADSCYAGTFAPSRYIVNAHANKDLNLKQLYRNRSRVLIASGGTEPAEDGSGKHSIFAKSLIRALNSKRERVFTASSLFSEIREPVSEKTKRHQVPLNVALYGASHKAGDFVFVKK